ncbi:DegT/DnrJ/EryC1/StrS family aminotransferase [Candidatus Dojkabacteria bacterium]|uniref:DegT/DnrJ/EryC1/StrS family aminotransferase n=1 Tax=Candidatus Dojkabacteria bacterium TaxID=2099670 RepID=A0A955I8T0_9BACT|nr:DegT/DnrJ/EryC1/StrS family aminotransferase [Candidatus Dojkabacteria bacterium]
MRPVFIGASPNTEKDDIKLAIKLLFQPWNWRGDKENSVNRFEKMVSEYHDGINAVAMDSARSAFYLLLKAYGIGPGDEVILPSFSCLVIANPVIWVGAKPVYVDIDKETFNLSLEDLKKKVTNKTKVILVQHTFGLPVELEKVREIVGKDVKIVEDIAHSLGGIYKGQKIGTIGDASVATFGIEKVISSVRGGMVLVKDYKIAEKIRKELAIAPHFSFVRTKIALLNPILWSIITPVYYVGVGKATIGRAFSFVAHKLGIMGIMIEKCEYDTQKPSWIPARMPSVLARLGMNQFGKLDRYNNHRREIAKIYEQKLGTFKVDQNSTHNYLRYPLLVEPEKRSRIYNIASKNHFVLGNWYKNILYAPDSSLEKLGYKKGDTPNAEWVAERIINLPTAVNISRKSAEILTEALENQK